MKKYIYAISYHTESRTGCCVISRNTKINSIDGFNSVQKIIGSELGTDDVVILNIMFIGKERR